MNKTVRYEQRARVMKALANPARLMLIDQLAEGERCICELQPLFPQNKSTLSRHVAALRNAGIVRERRDGVRVYLSLVTPCILNIFDCVSSVMKKTGRS
jgi:ArsR family transcriptional regulator